MLTLKLQYLGHLRQTANSLEKTVMLGKIEGRRRRGLQRMRWLNSKLGVSECKAHTHYPILPLTEWAAIEDDIWAGFWITMSKIHAGGFFTVWTTKEAQDFNRWRHAYKDGNSKRIFQIERTTGKKVSSGCDASYVCGNTFRKLVSNKMFFFHEPKRNDLSWAHFWL